VIAQIERLLDNETAGDPMSSLRWTHKTTIKIAGQLHRLGIQVGARTVARLLGKLRFSLLGNRKNISSGSRSGRDQQFDRIARLRKCFCRQGDPIISVDAKKRELVGNFKNAGVKWERVSTQVNDHDFRSLAAGIALPTAFTMSKRTVVLCLSASPTRLLPSPSIPSANGGSVKAIGATPTLKTC
jgi:hypothetical protein